MPDYVIRHHQRKALWLYRWRLVLGLRPRLRGL
jgi:hypothetical protein